jgi:hypothetical protein
VALKLVAICVDGRSVRKLWIARLLFVLAAGGLAGVVIEERRQQAADDERLERSSGPAERHQAFEFDGTRRPLPYSTSR